MRLMVAMAGCCCALLVGLAAALWRSIVRERQMRMPPRAFAEVMRETRWRPQRAMARPPHPRMDLAAGVAVGSPRMQQVRHDPRELDVAGAEVPRRPSGVHAVAGRTAEITDTDGRARRTDFD